MMCKLSAAQNILRHIDVATSDISFDIAQVEERLDNISQVLQLTYSEECLIFLYYLLVHSNVELELFNEFGQYSEKIIKIIGHNIDIFKLEEKNVIREKTVLSPVIEDYLSGLDLLTPFSLCLEKVPLKRPYNFWELPQLKLLDIGRENQTPLIVSGYDYFEDCCQINSYLGPDQVFQVNPIFLHNMKFRSLKDFLQVCKLSKIIPIIRLDLLNSSKYQELRDWIFHLIPEHFVVLWLSHEQDESSLKEVSVKVFSYLEIERSKNAISNNFWDKEIKYRNINIDQQVILKLKTFYTLPFSKMNRILDEYEWNNNRMTSLHPVNSSILISLCREKLTRSLLQYADIVDSSYGWEDLIVPSHTKLKLYEIYHSILYRSRIINNRHKRGNGIVAVFNGESGTGKTMAAEVMANELGVDLYKIDLANICSKYIGETEKNLSKIFKAARESQGILFFDEGESLFSQRKQGDKSSDRYANLEVNYLLQELESYNGLVIISTNYFDHIDKAFLRRITYEVHFPFPREEVRYSIWEEHLKNSCSLGCDDSVDYSFLSRLSLTGGMIRNVVKKAIFYSVRENENSRISMTHILRSIKREYQKQSWNINREQFPEEYWREVSPEWEQFKADKQIKQILNEEHKNNLEVKASN